MKSKSHQNNFNLLRLIFASLVIVSHVPELQTGDRSTEILTRAFGTISFGELAVDSFFVLSGYLIVKSWCDRPSVIAFLTSRVLRIFPGFLVAAIICAFVVGPLYGDSGYLGKFETGNFLIGIIQLKITGVPAVFQGAPYPIINGALWTIPYEFKCYVMVLVLGILRLKSFRKIWLAILLVSTSVSVLISLDVLSMHNKEYARLVMAFSAGGCLYLYEDAMPWNAGFAVSAASVFFTSIAYNIFPEVSLSIFFGYILIFFAAKKRDVFSFNKLPDVSYGVYLYAWPISKIILWHFPKIGVFHGVTLTFLFPVIIGVLSWYIIEKPMMALKGAVIKSEAILYLVKTVSRFRVSLHRKL